MRSGCCAVGVPWAFAASERGRRRRVEGFGVCARAGGEAPAEVVLAEAPGKTQGEKAEGARDGEGDEQAGTRRRAKGTDGRRRTRAAAKDAAPDAPAPKRGRPPKPKPKPKPRPRPASKPKPKGKPPAKASQQQQRPRQKQKQAQAAMSDAAPLVEFIRLGARDAAVAFAASPPKVDNIDFSLIDFMAPFFARRPPPDGLGSAAVEAVNDYAVVWVAFRRELRAHLRDIAEAEEDGEAAQAPWRAVKDVMRSMEFNVCARGHDAAFAAKTRAWAAAYRSVRRAASKARATSGPGFAQGRAAAAAASRLADAARTPVPDGAGTDDGKLAELAHADAQHAERLFRGFVPNLRLISADRDVRGTVLTLSGYTDPGGILDNAPAALPSQILAAGKPVALCAEGAWDSAATPPRAAVELLRGTLEEIGQSQLRVVVPARDSRRVQAQVGKPLRLVPSTAPGATNTAPQFGFADLADAGKEAGEELRKLLVWAAVRAEGAQKTPRRRGAPGNKSAPAKLPPDEPAAPLVQPLEDKPEYTPAEPSDVLRIVHGALGLAGELPPPAPPKAKRRRKGKAEVASANVPETAPLAVERVDASTRYKACATALLADGKGAVASKKKRRRLLVASDDAAVDAVLAAVLELDPSARCLRLGHPTEGAVAAMPALGECNVYTYLARELSEWRGEVAAASRGLARKRRAGSETQRAATERKLAALKKALAEAEQTAFDVAVGDADVLAVTRARLGELPKLLGGADVRDRPLDLCVMDDTGTVPPLERLAWLAPARRGVLVFDVGPSKAPRRLRFVPSAAKDAGASVAAMRLAAGSSLVRDAEVDAVVATCDRLAKDGLRVAVTSPYAGQVMHLRARLPEMVEVATPERIARGIPYPPDVLVLSLALPAIGADAQGLGLLADGAGADAEALARAASHARQMCVIVADPSVIRAIAAGVGGLAVLARRALREPWRPQDV